MNGIPASGGRPPRRCEGFTSASSHPELLSGDLAAPPRPYASIAAVKRSDPFDRVLLAIFALVALVSAIMLMRGTSSDDASIERQRLARSCMQWHLAASAVVGRLVQSTRDADLLQVSDAVFRMRRARRNCDAGWYVLACQDYHAVVIGAPGTVMGNQVFPCARIAESSS